MDDFAPSPTTVTLQRGLSVEPTLVRGIVHELAQSGEWAGLSGHGVGPVELHVSDGGSGSSVIEVSQRVPPEREDAARAALMQALDDLDRMLVHRTTDAS